MENKPKIAVAMSGGVDSGASALLAKQNGYDAFGVTMRLYKHGNEQDLHVDKDISDAKTICDKIGIGHKVYDFGSEFNKYVVDNFVQTYINGQTPNPCVVCNKYLKFGILLQTALNDGADKIATGHYATIENDNGRYLLRTATDKSKDQTYVLWSLDQHQLAHTTFPLGQYTKAQIREIAEENNLVNAHKSDSQDICFIPDGDYSSFISRHSGYVPHPGNYIDIQGNIIGTHKGIIHYTIGQRKGLGISLGKHIFVKEKNAENNTVTLSDEQCIFSKKIVIKNINLIPFDSLKTPLHVQAKIRYSQKASPAIAEMTGEDEITLTFDEPQRAAALGQSAVMYDGDYVVGGGIISKTI